MSLINDALKRASQTKLPPQAEIGENLQPVDARQSSIWLWVGCAAALMLAGLLATWAIAAGVLADRELKAARKPAPEMLPRTETTSPVETASYAQAKTNPPEPLQTSAPTLQPLGPATTSVPTNVIPSNNVVAAVVDPKPAPTLKLQGIFWKPSKPMAMINAKTVGLGDKILGAKVLAIDQESVTLDKAGETVILTLP
jgi:hypothetical protein